jgi:hypothetical protein
LEELKTLIDDAAGLCHSASYKARDLGHADAEQETAEIALQLENLLGRIESQYPDEDENDA